MPPCRSFRSGQHSCPSLFVHPRDTRGLVAEEAVEVTVRVGRATLDSLAYLGGLGGLGGRAAYFTFVAPWQGRRLRLDRAAHQAMVVGLQALPILSLITFFIGVILALQSAYELRKFGALHYVSGAVAISMTRELGPLMTAIVVIGRSGSAFAAEIGTMKVTEELDALETMALNPVQFLVTPKFLAMVVMLPCLTTWADLMGILGGALFGVAKAGFTFTSYLRSSLDALYLRDIRLRFGEKEILLGISFDVRRYETLVILGGSGSGKSTLLRALVRLEKPSAGEIWVKGKNMAQVSGAEMDEIRKKLGMSFQGGALFGSLTVGENVALPLREHTKLEDLTIQIIVRLKLEQVGLAGFEDYMPSQLSGGVKKRAAVARAMAMDPEILFFDEPSAGLDPIIAAGIDNPILKLKKAFRISIAVVTPELASAFLYAHRE